MAAYQLCADNVTAIINGTVIADFAEGDILSITPVNPSTGRTNGNNGSVVVKQRVDKDVHNIVIKVIKYSESDIFLNSLEGQCPPVLLNGSIKESYTKDGKEGQGTWSIESGSFTTKPTDGFNNQDGSPIVEYTIQANCKRTI